MTAVQKRIQACYGDCYRLAMRFGADGLLSQSLEAAREGERSHRRIGGRLTSGHARYRWPVADAARYFACKWFLDVAAYAPPQDWASATELRDDCRLAYAACSKVLRGIGERHAEELDKLRSDFADVLALDYAEECAVRS